MSLHIPDWDEYFFRHVYLVSSKSKDTRTKIGAVLVRDRCVISEGYNGFPRGVDDEVAERKERPLKYEYVSHAERNSVYQCARFGVSALGATMYTNGVPCSDCAKAVIQAGIEKIYVHKQWQEHEIRINREKWEKSCEISYIMLREAGVQIWSVDKVLNLQTFVDGQVITV